MTSYQPREITKILIESLENIPVVVLSGMRQTGKSTLLLNQPQLKKRRYVSFDDFNTLELARSNPEELLSGKEPITIDEAQKYPEILNVIKKEVDQNRKPGRFLLSGSANFLLLKKVAESLAGRAVYMTLHPFTRREMLGRTKEKPALAHFMDTGAFPKREINPVSLKEILKGGMPSVCLGQVKKPEVWFRGYEQTYLERDIRSLAQVADLVSFRNLLHLVALRNTKILNISELARDAKLNVVTTSRYLSLMEASFILNRVQPHFKNKTTRLIKSPKVYLSDTGLSAYLEEIKDSNVNEMARGALLESYGEQNLEGILSAYYPGAKITYWNIQGRYEVDFIIEVGGQTLAIEVKSGSRWKESDLAGIKAYLAGNKECLGGLLAYNGRDVLKLGKNIWAVPVNLLLS
ncbi:MAG: ATP-binding protein [Candidatus Omnitrophota bacterium]|nr:ATP-binding protein [Candidatus Omnitrophota bacterium]